MTGKPCPVILARENCEVRSSVTASEKNRVHPTRKRLVKPWMSSLFDRFQLPMTPVFAIKKDTPRTRKVGRKVFCELILLRIHRSRSPFAIVPTNNPLPVIKPPENPGFLIRENGSVMATRRAAN